VPSEGQSILTGGSPVMVGARAIFGVRLEIFRFGVIPKKVGPSKCETEKVSGLEM